MASNNLQKFVQNNFHLNPWVLSKNTNEIVNACIQKIYKQFPYHSKKDLKSPKVAAARPENKAPIRCYQSLQKEQPSAKIIPQSLAYPPKKSSRSNDNRHKFSQERLMNILKTSSKLNLQMYKSTSVASNKKLLKSPNLKIYGSRRYGSSANSSRSSLFRLYDERRRQKQPYRSQLNFLMRSFHSGRFNESITNCLMPLRNQKVKSNLGSLPEAMRVSSSIQNDLMIIDAAIRNRISLGGGKKVTPVKPVNQSLEVDPLQVWKHPPPLENFSIKTLTDLVGESRSKALQSKESKLSPEHRDFGRFITTKQYKNPSPILQEKQRRYRMKKLGLIQNSPKTSSTVVNRGTKKTLSDPSPPHQTKDCLPVIQKNNHQTLNVVKREKAGTAAASNYSKIPKFRSYRPPRPSSDVLVTETASEASSLNEKRIGPLALATANFGVPFGANSSVYKGLRNNRSTSYAQRKY